MPGINLRAFWTRWNRSVEFQLVESAYSETTGEPVLRIAKPVEMVEAPTNPIEPPATFAMNIDAAQNLFDHLWWLGFRPAEQYEAQRNDATVAAQKEHIVDLRNVVMRLGDKFLK